MKPVITGIILTMAAICCDRDRDLKSINFVNNSDIAVTFICSQAYPDTSLHSVFLCGNGELDPNTSFVSYDDIGWEDRFKGGNNYGILCFFALDAQILENTPYDTIEKYYMILKRYEYTSQDMDSINWTITYP